MKASVEVTITFDLEELRILREALTKKYYDAQANRETEKEERLKAMILALNTQ